MTRTLDRASIFIEVILIKMAADSHLLVGNWHSRARVHVALVWNLTALIHSRDHTRLCTFIFDADRCLLEAVLTLKVSRWNTLQVWNGRVVFDRLRLLIIFIKFRLIGGLGRGLAHLKIEL